jgi:hypothetical protein
MKAFFLSRLLREKVLLVAFVLIAASIWLSNVSTRASVLVRDFRRTSSDLAEQRLVLSQAKAIAARAKAAIDIFVPSKTIDGDRLPGEINSIANATGVANPVIDNPQTQKSGQFSLNTVQVSLRNVPFDKLEEFYDAVSKRHPYIGIEQITIRASNSSALNVSIKLSSVAVVGS